MKQIILVIIIFFYSCQMSTNKFVNNQPSLNEVTNKMMFSIENGNQDSLIFYAEITQDWLDSLHSQYPMDDFYKYDNRTWEYMTFFFDNVIEKSGVETYEELWDKLNRPQKVFWAFLAFNGDTDNGGVYQFFFNRPQYSIAVLEAWKELKLDRLEKDYTKVLEELLGSADKISSLKDKFNDSDLSWEKRAAAFNEGYVEMPSAKIIENYYYTDDFKEELLNTVARYIEDNLEYFCVIKVD